MDRTNAPPEVTCVVSAAKYRSRSAGSSHDVTVSSAWSTTRVCRVRSPLMESMGRTPGVVTRTAAPLRLRDATTPARTSDDLPMPDGPTTASTLESRSLRRHTARSASLPKNESASSASYGSRPR